QLGAILLLTCYVFRPALSHAPRADTLSFLNHLGGLEGFGSIMGESLSMNRRPARFFSDNPKGNPRFSFLSYKPGCWLAIGLQKWLFGYRFRLWECVQVGLHMAVVIVLFRMLTRNRPAAHVVPVLLTAWFAVQYTGMEMAVQLALAGMLLSVLCAMVFLAHVRRGLSAGRVGFRWVPVAALAAGVFTFEVSGMTAGIVLILGLVCNVVHQRRRRSRGGGPAPFSAALLCAVAAIIVVYFGANLADMYLHAETAPGRGDLQDYDFQFSKLAHAFVFAQGRWFGSGMLPAWLKMNAGGRIEAWYFAPRPGAWASLSVASAALAAAAYVAMVIFGRRSGRARGNLVFLATIVSLMLAYPLMIVVYRVSQRGLTFTLNNGTHYAYLYNLLGVIVLGCIVGAPGRGSTRKADVAMALLFGAGMLGVIAANACLTRTMNRRMARWSAGRNEMIRRAEYLVGVHREEPDFTFAVRDCPVNYPIHWFHRSRPSICHVLYPHCYDPDDPKWVLDCSDVLAELALVTLLEQNYRGFNIVAGAGRVYAVAMSEGAFSVAAMQRGRYKRCYAADSVEQARAAVDRALAAQAAPSRKPEPRQLPASTPRLVEEAYHGFNIIACAGRFFALAQSEGAFVLHKAQQGGYRQCFAADSPAQAKALVDRHLGLGGPAGGG
ncbi:MAG: hypothetical protein ACYS5V_02590, partial [Planctomycetota bacterium]